MVAAAAAAIRGVGVVGGRHRLPQYLDVYSQMGQTCPARTAGTATTQSSNPSTASWTLGSKCHRHSQTLGSLSRYSQRHRERGRAYRNRQRRWTEVVNRGPYHTATALKQSIVVLLCCFCLCVSLTPTSPPSWSEHISC